MSQADETIGRHLDHLPFPVLIGDIGGTNARFSLVPDETGPVHRFANVHTADFASIDDAVEAVVIDRGGAKPKSAMLALAGPIAGDRVPLTNSPWVVEPKKSVARFGLAEMVLLNDFEAQSLALPELTEKDIAPIGDGTMSADGARVVLGPGTGLGAGALVKARDVWVPVPGEGGHIDLSPVSERDFAIWPHVERTGGRIGAETLLCGSGMVRLYRAVCASDGVAPEFATPKEVTEAGLSGASPQAAETLSLFAVHLGRVAGNLALVFMPAGGVFLAGGISARIAPVLQLGGFREAFLSKWPHRRLLERLATSIVTKEDAALAGIAAFARAPAHFAVSLTGRRWRG